MKVFDETNIGRRTSNQDKVAIVNTRRTIAGFSL